MWHQAMTPPRNVMAAQTGGSGMPSGGTDRRAVLVDISSMSELGGQCASDEHGSSASVGTARLEELIMFIRHVHAPALCIVLLAFLAFSVSLAAAQDQNIGHFGKNRLKFATVEPFSLPDATGTGIVDYKGGREPESQWRASFRFAGLEPGASYTVVIKGRFGASGSAEASAFTALCSFQADVAGQGGCFWYFRGLARLNLVQLRAGDENGTQVLEANRARGPGSIETEPNRFSPGGEISGRK